MASSLLNTFNKIDNGRKGIINSLNNLGINLNDTASFNTIDNAIRTIEVSSDSDVRDPNLTKYYENPLENDPDLPKPSKLFLEYVDKFNELEPIEYNGYTYYPAIITFIDTAIDEVIFNVDTYANGSAKTNGIRIGQYGNHIVRTSDGGEYIFTQSTEQFTHTWDKTKDLYDEDLGINVRYLITYSKSTLSALKAENIKTLYYILSMRRFTSSNSSVYSNVLYGYMYGKHPSDTYSQSLYIPPRSAVKQWLYIDEVPLDIIVGDSTSSDTNPNVYATVFITKLKHTSPACDFRYNFSVAYIETPVIKPEKINMSSTDRKYGQLKYLNIVDKDTQESLYKGALVNMYPPLLKDPYFSTLITKITASTPFMTGVNIKNFSLPNLTESTTTAFDSGIFHTLDLSNVNIQFTFAKASIVNLDLSGMSELTAKISGMKDINYINLSNAKTISNYIAQSGGDGSLRLKELDISSAEIVSERCLEYVTGLKTLRLKQDFAYSLTIPYNMNFTLECIRDIFDKAKAFTEDDELYKTYTLKLSGRYQDMLPPHEIQAFLDKGWNITWNSSY